MPQSEKRMGVRFNNPYLRDRELLEGLLEALGTSPEKIMDLVAATMRKKGDVPTVIMVGMPSIVFHSAYGKLDLLIKDDLPPGTIVVR